MIIRGLNKHYANFSQSSKVTHIPAIGDFNIWVSWAHCPPVQPDQIDECFRVINSSALSSVRGFDLFAPTHMSPTSGSPERISDRMVHRTLGDIFQLRMLNQSQLKLSGLALGRYISQQSQWHWRLNQWERGKYSSLWKWKPPTPARPLVR